jgi:hypothetical protein
MLLWNNVILLIVITAGKYTTLLQCHGHKKPPAVFMITIFSLCLRVWRSDYWRKASPSTWPWRRGCSGHLKTLSGHCSPAIVVITMPWPLVSFECWRTHRCFPLYPSDGVLMLLFPGTVHTFIGVNGLWPCACYLMVFVCELYVIKQTCT